MEDKKIKLVFDCVLNDPLTIELTHGLEPYSGYEFIIYEKDLKEMRDFIKEVIISNGLPIDNIYTSTYLYEDEKDRIDTKEDIVRKILEGKEQILDQLEISERCYQRELGGYEVAETIHVHAHCVDRGLKGIENYYGPRYEGFHFLIKKEDEEEMTKFIKETIISYDLPFIEIVTDRAGITNVHNVDTKEDIITEILETKDYILNEYNEQRNKQK